jgi:large subunit ribosomal protein L9
MGVAHFGVVNLVWFSIMKVILLRDVARLGRKGEVKDVPDGHAINFLIPRKLVMAASSENLKKHARESQKNAYDSQKARDVFAESVRLLSEANVVYKVEANDNGHLFKGVHVEDIVARCNEEDGVALTNKQVVLPHPLKEVGVHEIPLMHEKQKAVIRFEIVKK